jgi:hypothetical protein
MEFEHLNQPDFDRERDGTVEDIVSDVLLGIPTSATTYSTNKGRKIARRAYNEGYKQALRDWSIWKDGVQHIGCMQHDIKEIIEEVDKIDGERSVRSMGRRDGI